MSTSEAKAIGHPDRFAYNEDGTVDWQTSTSRCLDRAGGMLDMIDAYVSSNRGNFPDLYDDTLESQLHAIQAELQDVGKLVEDWHHEQWQKERKKADA